MNALTRRLISSAAMAIVMITSMSSQALGDVILTFDLNPTNNAALIPQDYGDRVTASPDSNGYSYNIVDDNLPGGTPNVLVEYGSNNPGVAGPGVWTSGYGDLTNIYFNDADADDAVQILFSADPGFEVGLFSFEMAAFGSDDLMVAGLEVRNGEGDILWSMGATTIVSGNAHNTFDLGAGVFGSALILDIDLTGLGFLSDNIGIDNVQFGQRGGAVPEPGSATLLLLGTGLMSLRRRR